MIPSALVPPGCRGWTSSGGTGPPASCGGAACPAAQTSRARPGRTPGCAPAGKEEKEETFDNLGISTPSSLTRGAVGMEVLGRRKRPTFSRDTFRWCGFKSFSCTLISDELTTHSNYLSFAFLSTRVPHRALCDVTKGTVLSPRLAEMPTLPPCKHVELQQSRCSIRCSRRRRTKSSFF